MVSTKKKRGKVYRTGIVHKSLKEFTEKRTKNMQAEINDLEAKYDSGDLLISYRQYRKLRIGILNKYAISRSNMKDLTKKYYSRS